MSSCVHGRYNDSLCPSFFQISNIDEQCVIATIELLTRQIDKIEFTLSCKYIIDI